MDWIRLDFDHQAGTGNGQIVFRAAANPSTVPRTASVATAGQQITVTQLGAAVATSGLRFHTVTPCRLVDTRGDSGVFGAPTTEANSTRDIPVPDGLCGIPASAQAYSLNVMVVPDEPLGYLTLWPIGQNHPFVSTLNSVDGRIVANAALVPAGTNGSLSVFTTNRTHLLADVNGYFDASASALDFHASTPCRVADTRDVAGPFGGPKLTGEASRDFAI